MAGQLTLRVISPDHIVFDETVETVVVPASDGAMGILPRHAPMVTVLDTGLVRYRMGGGIEGLLFVSGGFGEVRDNTVRVVTQAGDRPEDIDEERAREAERRARQRLEEGRAAGGEVDVLRAEAALRRALLRLRARELAL